MSNLIQYIIQEDPEEEMKKKQSQSLLSRESSSQEDTDKNYKFNSRHLLENDFSHLNSKQAPTARSYLSQALTNSMATEGNKVSSALSPKPIGNDNASYKVAQNNKPNIANDAKVNQTDYSLYGNGFSKEFIDEMVNDKEFNQILNEYIIPNEGGLSDKPNDRGKLTKFGISKNTYPNEDILNLTRERANAIIYRDFYKWNGLNKLPYPIRGFVVDYGMPSSPLNAIKTVHKVLGLPSNGNIIGSATMEKLKNFSQQDYEKFLEQYKQSMLEHYNNIVKNDPTQKGNLKGWLNRANRAHLGK